MRWLFRFLVDEYRLRRAADQTQDVLSLRNELTDLTTSLAYVMTLPGGTRDEFHASVLAQRYAHTYRALIRTSSRPAGRVIEPGRTLLAPVLE